MDNDIWGWKFITPKLTSHVMEYLEDVTAFGQRLVSRMSQVGSNGGLASKRRQQWSREEHWAKLEREASWLERVQGHSIVNRGRFWRGAGR